MFDKRIITIHDVAKDTMTADRLDKIIKASLKIGYKFVSIDEILNPQTKGLKLCLTIDDAYKSTITTIINILERYNIHATLFIPTGLLGYSANSSVLLDNDCYVNKDMMTWEDVQEWVTKGQDIGFHTHNHIDLYHKSNSEIKFDFELGIETLCNHELAIRFFAYPKGFLPKNREMFNNLLRQHGIEYAFTVNRGKVDPKNRFYINRTLIGNKEPFLWSMCKIIGLEDIHYYLIKQKRNREVIE